MHQRAARRAASIVHSANSSRSSASDAKRAWWSSSRLVTTAIARPQQRQRAVRLVGLGHQQRAATGPGVAAQLRHLAADQVGGIEPQLLGRVGDHGRGGGLAVGAGHADRAPRGHHLGEQLGAVQPAQAQLAGGQQLRLVGGDRRRDDQLHARLQVGRVMADRDRDPEPGEPLGVGRRRAVAAASPRRPTRRRPSPAPTRRRRRYRSCGGGGRRSSSGQRQQRRRRSRAAASGPGQRRAASRHRLRSRSWSDSSARHLLRAAGSG